MQNIELDNKHQAEAAVGRPLWKDVTEAFEEPPGRCYEPEEPPWMEALADRSRCVFHDDGFWYETAEDLSCGLSQVNRYHPPPEWARLLNHPRLGSLRVFGVGGQQWASANDIARISGLPKSYFVGWYCYHWPCVRGEPGLLDPDGIRLVTPDPDSTQGMTAAVRLEAVPGILRRYGLRPDLAEWCERHAAALDPSEFMEVRKASVASPWRTEMKLAGAGAPTAWRLCFDDGWAVRVARLGMWLWVDLQGAAQNTEIDPEIIRQSAGPWRILEIPDAAAYSSIGGAGAGTFIRSDVVDNLIDCGLFVSKRWNIGHVRGGRLREVLPPPDGHKIAREELEGIIGPECLQGTSPRPEFVTAEEACRIACYSFGFAGWVTAILLSEGGVLHGGSFRESPGETLRRFWGLAVDSDDGVSLFGVWEFLNRPGSFDEWVAKGLARGLSLMDQDPAHARVQWYSAWCVAISTWEPPPFWEGGPPW